jgi:type IV pilus assembly protein PilA
MQLKKKPQLDALNKQAVSRTTKQLKTNPQLDALNKQAASSEKNLPPHKKSKSCVETLVRIAFIYVPAVMISLVAIPSFICGSASGPKLSEPKQYVGLMNKAQQAKYANDGAFYNSINAMTSGIKTQKTNYKYSIIATKNAAFSYAVSIRETKNLTSYVGAVFLVPVSQAAKNEKTTVSILCAANSSGNTQPPAPIIQNDNPVCAAGSRVVIK